MLLTPDNAKDDRMAKKLNAFNAVAGALGIRCIFHDTADHDVLFISCSATYTKTMLPEKTLKDILRSNAKDIIGRLYPQSQRIVLRGDLFDKDYDGRVIPLEQCNSMHMLNINTIHPVHAENGDYNGRIIPPEQYSSMRMLHPDTIHPAQAEKLKTFIDAMRGYGITVSYLEPDGQSDKENRCLHVVCDITDETVSRWMDWNCLSRSMLQNTACTYAERELRPLYPGNDVILMEGTLFTAEKKEQAGNPKTETLRTLVHAVIERQEELQQEECGEQPRLPETFLSLAQRLRGRNVETTVGLTVEEREDRYIPCLKFFFIQSGRMLDLDEGILWYALHMARQLFPAGEVKVCMMGDMLAREHVMFLESKKTTA